MPVPEVSTLTRYSQYMKEIKHRSNSIRLIIDFSEKFPKLNDKEPHITGYAETDIDTIYLQLRKIVELIFFSCIVASEEAGIELNKMLRKSHEPPKIRDMLQKYNKSFLQQAKTDKGYVDGIRHLEDREEKTASVDDLVKIHGFCGNILHAQREYQYKDKNELLLKACDYHNQITELLGNHWIKIDDERFFATIMSVCGTDEVHVTQMQKIDESEIEQYMEKSPTITKPRSKPSAP